MKLVCVWNVVNSHYWSPRQVSCCFFCALLQIVQPGYVSSGCCEDCHRCLTASRHPVTVTAFDTVSLLLRSRRPVHVLFPLFRPVAAAPLQHICAQCVYQCGLFSVLLCRLTGATLRQLNCNPDCEAQAWTAHTNRNLCSLAVC